MRAPGSPGGAGCHSRARTRPAAPGYTLLELVLSVATAATLAGMAIPVATSTVDHLRTSAAARHVAARIATARLDAIRRSTTVALRFERAGEDYSFSTVIDGNANGIRAADITRGDDRVLSPPERLAHNFSGVVFGLHPGVPDIDGAAGSLDGVRIGSSAFLSLTPLGTSTSGTLYVRGRRAQFAVRILGATGRVRVFRYDGGIRRWTSR